MSNLLIPDTPSGRVAAKMAHERRQKEAMATAKAMSGGTQNALQSDDFLDKPGVQAQLDQLAGYIAERREEDPDYHLPLPSGWRIQVLMLTIPEKSKGGLQMVDDSREQRSMASPQGVILAMGPSAYSDPTRFSDRDGNLAPWHAVGDRIQFVKYDAQPFQLPNGQRLGILTDTQPVATLDSGWEVPR